MPAIRSAEDLAKFKLKVQSNAMTKRSASSTTTSSKTEHGTHGTPEPYNVEAIYFPTSELERQHYRSPSGKVPTPHEWAVYDLCLQIPIGRVTTYKIMCDMLGGGSPRSVGSALRKNPFAPYVPCHRVISSDLSLGGFKGEWGTQEKAGSTCAEKVEILDQEGVNFDSRGKLKGGSGVLWRRC